MTPNANPFANRAPQAPQSAPTAAPVAQAAQVDQAAPVTPEMPAAPGMPPQNIPTAAPVSEKKERKPRKTPNRQMTDDERKYVLQNYSTKSTGQIAQDLGLTRQQVYRTIHESRKALQKRLESLQAQPQSAERDAMVDKVQKLLDTLPAKPFGGGNTVGGKRKNGIDSVLDNLLA